MWNKAIEIKNSLFATGYVVSLGFYNNHYVKDGDDFAVEYFPIPIISLDAIGDIGIDIDTCWVEIHLDKSKAVSIDYLELAQRYNFEVYGAEDFCSDFYNKQTDPREVTKKIDASNESLINVTLYLDLDTKTDEIVNAVKQFTK
jgi:hypothetical protein